MKPKELRERLLERDDNAVADFNNSGQGRLIEGRIAFIEGRLTDTLTAVIQILKLLEEKDEARP